MKELKDLFGSGPIGVVLVVVLALVLLKLEEIFNIEKIVLNGFLFLLAGILIAAGVAVIGYSFVSLPPSKRGKELVSHGPFKYVRHPLYSAIIFLLYPGATVLLNSWLLLAATILVYLIFKIVIGYEEKHLIEIFGEEYKQYMEKVPQFIPKIFNNVLAPYIS